MQIKKKAKKQKQKQNKQANKKNKKRWNHWARKYKDLQQERARNANPNADPPIEAREIIDAPTNATFENNRHKMVCSCCYSFNTG